MFRNIPQRRSIQLCLCGLLLAATLLTQPLFVHPVAAATSGLVAAPAAGVWLDVPFIRQEKDGCGAASIAMVMQYWRQKKALQPDAGADAQVIQQALFSSKDHGIRAADMERYFKDHDYQVFSFTGKWEDFQQHIQKGRPLIVALKPSGLEASLHYVVVVGVDPEKDVVLVNDAAQRKLLQQDRKTFEHQWSAVGRWTLLALPK